MGVLSRKIAADISLASRLARGWGRGLGRILRLGSNQNIRFLFGDGKVSLRDGVVRGAIDIGLLDAREVITISGPTPHGDASFSHTNTVNIPNSWSLTDVSAAAVDQVRSDSRR